MLRAIERQIINIFKGVNAMSAQSVSRIRGYEQSTGSCFLEVQNLEIMGDHFHVAVFSNGGLMVVE